MIIGFPKVMAVGSPTRQAKFGESRNRGRGGRTRTRTKRKPPSPRRPDTRKGPRWDDWD
jgi:hypothetical protein